MRSRTQHFETAKRVAEILSASQDEAGRFTVEVINHGPWKEPVTGHNGHGLAMMNELMSEVRTKTSISMLSG